MKLTRIFLFIFLHFFGYSCAQYPESYMVETALPQEVPTGIEHATVFSLKPEHSLVTWIGTKPTGQHTGTIGVSDGRLYAKDGLIFGGEFTMDMYDIEIFDLPAHQKEKLTNHLFSVDFFDVENHPISKFVLTQVLPLESNLDQISPVDTAHMLADPTHMVTGNFRMRGINLSISFPAKIDVNQNKITAHARFNLDRTKWGVSHWDESTVENRTKDKLIHNVVHVEFRVETQRQATDS